MWPLVWQGVKRHFTSRFPTSNKNRSQKKKTKLNKQYNNKFLHTGRLGNEISKYLIIIDVANICGTKHHFLHKSDGFDMKLNAPVFNKHKIYGTFNNNLVLNQTFNLSSCPTFLFKAPILSSPPHTVKPLTSLANSSLPPAWSLAKSMFATAKYKHEVVHNTLDTWFCKWTCILLTNDDVLSKQ